jgi:hypothetical protein
MAATATDLACAQCGRAAPGDPAELTGWAYGPIALRGEFPEVIDVLLLCPECVVEDHDHEFDEGGTG